MNTQSKIAETYTWIKGMLIELWFRLIAILKLVYRITGYLLIYLGSAMVKKDRKYLLVIETIENLYSSLDVVIHVVGYHDEPLFVSFGVEIESSVDHVVDWKYFTTELIYQLGCNLSDVVIEHDSKNSAKSKNYYNIDITKTAITNLEKGTSPVVAHVFEETNTDALMKKAIQLSKTQTITSEVLEENLGIDAYRAERIYKQLLQAGVLDNKRNKILN